MRCAAVMYCTNIYLLGCFAAVQGGVQLQWHKPDKAKTQLSMGRLPPVRQRDLPGKIKMVLGVISYGVILN